MRPDGHVAQGPVAGRHCRRRRVATAERRATHRSGDGRQSDVQLLLVVAARLRAKAGLVFGMFFSCPATRAAALAPSRQRRRSIPESLGLWRGLDGQCREIKQPRPAGRMRGNSPPLVRPATLTNDEGPKPDAQPSISLN